MRPSYATGFARYPADSKYPELWRGLVGAWCPFLGNTGPDFLRDMSGRHNTGIWNGTGNRWGLGPDGPVAIFNGTDDYLSCGNSSILELDSKAIVLWIKTSDSKGGMVDRLQNGGAFGGFTFMVGATSPGKPQYFDTGCSWETSNTRVDDGEWNCVGLTIGAGNGTFYLNGSADGTFVGAFPGAYTGSLLIAQSYSSFELAVEIGQVLIYNRGLSMSEMLTLYRTPHLTWEVDYTPYARVAVAAASMPVIMQQMNQFDGGTAV